MVANIMEKVDVNKDGVIDFQEFTDMMLGLMTAEPKKEEEKPAKEAAKEEAK